jgi:segregation and condensation protein A
MFEDLLGKDRLSIMAVVTFMAMLELTKIDRVIFRQSETNGPLWIYRKRGNDEYKEELAQEIEERRSLDFVLKSAMQMVEGGLKIEEGDIQTMLEGL